MKTLGIVLTFISLFFHFPVEAQSWTQAEYDRANTAEHANFLSNEEKDVILYLNLIRMDGEKFYNTLLQEYIENYNNKVRKYRNYAELRLTPNNWYYTSLWKNLRGVKNLPLFYPDEKLSKASKNHALDLYRNNLAGHESSNGDSFNKRLSYYYPNKTMSENIDFGYSTSLEIVCHLLLDCGVPNLGHRLTILDQKYKLNTVGVSIQPHRRYEWCAVIDYISMPDFYSSNR
ncbi:CAP domain-containing protein [Pedobacter sp. MW01-1-1]|uniref:CAP domain-containing protein n=1 Tax=Pedobacter sp. MW01-1-1 TaxID=3383027 RepID=UPI003FF0D207